MGEHDYSKSKRTEAIARAYNNTGAFSPEIVECGNQIMYEVEQDLTAMKWAISYLHEYIELHPNAHFNIKTALNGLVKRVAEYSCPNNLKAGNNCPMKDKCTFPECRK